MKRGYVMTARADAAQATADRIIAATFDRMATTPYDQMRLEDVAADAGVTVQTVIRRFGSKEGLARAAHESYAKNVAGDGSRGRTVPGDVPGAAEGVVAQYEESGDLLLHLLRQESSVPVFAEFMESGRGAHLRWCREIFAPLLDSRSGVDRERLLAQVAAVCDVYTWFLLRRQRGLSRRQTVLAITELLEGLL
jgi:AcrR family transcriptional regulator